MKIICEDGLVLDCTDFKAIDRGVIVIGGEEDQNAVGYVPNERVEYVLPDEVVELEHERLGVPAPEISSTEELESRLESFVEEIDDLRESLDRQVEDLIDEGAPFEEENVDRRDRLYERRRDIDRALEQVRTRANQFQQLSLAEAETAESGAQEASEAQPSTESATDVESLRTEMDERLSNIERQLEALDSSSEETRAESAEANREAAAQPLESISGLGPTYRDRLEDAGIETLDDLANSDPANVVEATDVAERKAQDWIDRANELASGERTSA